jgi:hypothetical protein
MTSFRSLDERFDQLVRELGDNAELSARVMRAVATRPRPAAGLPRTDYRRIARRGMFGLLAAMAVALLLVVLPSRPDSLYARAVTALDDAETVHVTGWTTRIVRKWPLEESRKDDVRKHAVEAWYWRDGDGAPRSHEIFGPVIQVRNGGELREYQQDVDLLYLQRGSAKDKLERFAALAGYLQALDRDGIRKEELGTREENGRTMRGLKLIEGRRTEEYWFDAQSNLPVRYVRSVQDDGAVSGFELQFAYNHALPQAVAHYVPPETRNVRYGSGHKDIQLAWRQHVQEIGIRLRDEPIEGRVALLSRKDVKTFAHQWLLRTPEGAYWVMPLDLDQYEPLSLKNFVNLRVAGFTSHECWRVPVDLQDIEFRREDLVFTEGTPWEQWTQYVLNRYGLEYVDVVAERTCWVARHDGSQLKPWQEVKPPVPYVIEGGVEKKGIVKPGIGQKLVPVTMSELFSDFNRNQSGRLTADSPIIVDETGLPRPPAWDKKLYPSYQQYRDQILEKYFVATDSPWFAGEESRPMAWEWYRKEFGISFTEERRPMTIHVVRRKE